MELVKYQVIEFSSAHITVADANSLALGAVPENSFPVVVYDYKHGFFIVVPSDRDVFREQLEALDTHGMSSMFLALFRLAREHGCPLLRIDADAAVVEGLPTTEW